MRKLIGACVLCILILTGVSACGNNRQESGQSYTIYYVDRGETHVVSEEYVTETTQKEALMQELINLLRDTSEKPEYISPLHNSFQGYTLNEGQTNLDFSEEYLKQNAILEVLCRAAVVRTLTQIEGIDTITFSVQNEALIDAAGIPVGVMTADSFIDNAGTEINAYAESTFSLYFANGAGDGLVEVDREVVYNSNISMERQVMEELLKGPKKDGGNGAEPGYPTINPAVTILSVTVKDRVCYVNLSKEFLTPVYDVTSQTVLYSIVNSLVELPGVNRVQISVEGNTDITYRDSVSLTTQFERNLDLVE